MAPNASGDAAPAEVAAAEVAPEDKPNGKIFLTPIAWSNTIIMGFLHVGALYGLVLVFTSASIYTTLFAYLMFFLSQLGIYAAAHRLWCHRCYKAKLSLRIFLMLLNTLCFQGSIYWWSRDHRLHHKFSDTDADPHNLHRGLFFSHIGWILLKKHPEAAKKKHVIDISDLERDPVVMFQHRHYYKMMVLLGFVIPTAIPVWGWGESVCVSFCVASALRYCLALNASLLLNSAAHRWGTRGFEKSIKPTDKTFISLLAMGEGWHNYHHVFPWDYKPSELGGRNWPNGVTLFIELCAWLGLAYDLKTVDPSVQRKRALRTGDGSLQFESHPGEEPPESATTFEEDSSTLY